MGKTAGTDYERSDIDPAVVGWIAVGLAAFVVAVPLVMPLIFPQSTDRGNPSARPALSANAPSLEVNPSDALRQQKAADHEFADTYGWSDRDHAMPRIPVNRAIERLLQTGRSGWPSSP